MLLLHWTTFLILETALCPLYDPVTWYKLHSGTAKTKAGQVGPVRVALFCNLRPTMCVLYHVAGSCKGPIFYIIELKHRRFWATDVNRKFMFMPLARFHSRPVRPGSTPYFTWAESNANEKLKPFFALIKLISIWLGSCEVRRLTPVLDIRCGHGYLFQASEMYWTCQPQVCNLILGSVDKIVRKFQSVLRKDSA